MNRSMSNVNRLILAVLGSAVIILSLSSVKSLNNYSGNPLEAQQIKEKNEQLKEKDGIIEQLTNKLACLTKGVLPSGGFCLDDTKTFQGGNNVWDGLLCAGLEEIFGRSSVGDFGAGLGHYGSCFLRTGNSIVKSSNEAQAESLTKQYQLQMKMGNLVDKPQVIKSWEGFDSAFNIEQLSGGKIHTTDLSVPLKLDRKYDWVLSLEVGEHIPQEKEQTFIDNLVQHTCKGVVLSWAVVGQGGYNHVNTRNNDYIQQQMEKRGLALDTEASQNLRKKVSVSWFKNTLMVYRFPKPKC
ncbi:uncharacterized protein LOC135220693 [Macrobrachium nipponense]|uniref:uncharacterized protein LOC135220693 n=1 Tax=Macrobrachium nipponense TaxID=159736 RepID=UPI0030C876C8